MASCQKSDAWRLVCQRHVWHSWWLWFLVGFNFVFMFNFELEAQAKYKWSVLDSAKAVGVGDFEWAAANASEKEFIYLQHCILALHETIAKKCYMSYRPWSFWWRCVWTAGHHSVRQVESWSPLGKCLDTLSWTAGRAGELSDMKTIEVGKPRGWL